MKKEKINKMNEKNQMYFATDPNAKHDEHIVDYKIDEIDLKFTTDAGVFSKMRIDYGSGVLIKAMKQMAFPKSNILDVGTGYGPIGLFAAKFWPDQQVEMVDVNERGLDLAKRNAKTNQITNVDIHSSDIYSDIHGQNFGLIVTNPPIRAGKKVVSSIIANADNYLTIGGILLVVIQKKQGEPSARKLMKEVYGNCEIVIRDKGYYILKAVKRAN